MFNKLDKTDNQHSNRANTSETAAMISAEFHRFVADVEDLVKASTSLTGDELSKVKTELNERIAIAKSSVVDASNTMAKRAKKAAVVSNHYVHEQPWQVIGATSVVGFLIGYLIARRS